ncbi:MAG: hypothetical protein ABSB19_03685 [Methylomonas sp.]|jgi:hypothetical protein
MSRIRTSEETAVILAALLKKADATRARISDKTIKLVSGRKRLEGSFRISLDADIAEYGYIIVKLESGSQAIVKISALESAKTITVKKMFSSDEIRALRNKTPDMDVYRNFVENEGSEENDDTTE